MENKKRLILMLAGAMDALIGGAALLIYFGILPLDISGWDIPRWVIGLSGAVLFFPGLAIFFYQLTRAD